MVNPVYQVIEVAILAATFVATLFIAWRVWAQTRRHFQIQHAVSFIERFNSAQMVGVRREVDAWLTTGESPTELNARIAAGDETARATSAALRTLTNFFQELGVAWKHRAVRQDYVWDVFGALVPRYWRGLEPYVVATRTRLGRPTLHGDFQNLAGRMRRMDEARDVPATTAPPAGAPTAWVFGYGSLFNPESIERSLSEPLDRSRLRVAWLNGFRRGWTVWDEMEFEGPTTVRRPLAFLGLTPDRGSRCNGILFPVSPEHLRLLDTRERCYSREDVSDAVDPSPGGNVYTYVGRPEFGVFPADVRIAQWYCDLIEAGLRFWGSDFRADYRATTGNAGGIELVHGRYHASPEAPTPVAPESRPTRGS